MKIRFERSFEKDLKSVKHDKNLLGRVRNVIIAVKEADSLKEINHTKKLRGYENFYRIRLGDYRIGCELLDDTVIFARILHRKDIYRYFP